MTLEATPVNTLLNLYDIAREKLHYVYLGNMDSRVGQNTYCPQCNELLVNRSGYHADTAGISEDLHCKKCNALVQNLIL